MVDSLAARGVKAARRKIERFTHGEVGNISRRSISEEELDRGVRTGLGRRQLTDKYGWAPLPVRGREIDTQLASGAGRWEYARGLRRKNRGAE